MSSELEYLKGLERQYELLVKKINALREKLAVEDDPSRKIKYEVELAQAEAELAQLADKIRGHMSIHSVTGRSLLAQQVAELGIGRTLGQIDLVNCNRKEPTDKFWDFYDELDPHRFQFYFLTSCETQKPGSFAERMLHQFIDEELDEATDAIYYISSDDMRPDFEPLPRGRNLEKCQTAFRKYFSTFWKLEETQSMEGYLKTGLPRFGFDAVAMFLTVEEAHWKEGVTRPFLEWIIDTFHTAHQDVPRVLVFLRIVVDNAHQRGYELEQGLVFRDVRAILNQHPGVAHLLPFGPVEKSDVEVWFRGIKTENTALLNRLLETFVQSLDPPDRKLYEESEQFNMDDIELLQKEVFKVVNKTHI